MDSWWEMCVTELAVGWRPGHARLTRNKKFICSARKQPSQQVQTIRTRGSGSLRYCIMRRFVHHRGNASVPPQRPTPRCISRPAEPCEPSYHNRPCTDKEVTNCKRITLAGAPKTFWTSKQESQLSHLLSELRFQEWV